MRAIWAWGRPGREIGPRGEAGLRALAAGNLGEGANVLGIVAAGRLTAAAAAADAMSCFRQGVLISRSSGAHPRRNGEGLREPKKDDVAFTYVAGLVCIRKTECCTCQ